MLIPFALDNDVKFSPPPTDRIAAVYRMLGVGVSRKAPDVRVTVDTFTLPWDNPGGKRFQFLWLVQPQPDGTVDVVISRKTGKVDIVKALFEAVD